MLLLSNCKDNSKTEEKKISVKKKEKVTLPTASNNDVSVIKEDNIFVIDQKFTKEDAQKNIIGKPVEVDLSTTSGAMISAYSTYNDEYTIFYKTLENNSWSDWLELEENEHVDNPNRKVFSPKNLNPSVQKIQFKSSKITKSEVVFRIYTFEK
ncbi:hypothetical protein LPB303_07235 [Polaribacter atrinae]|uniref:Uncharacterized protein n=1 Tax=Polaribacter atrinae TaxID=1333662 RepID=A0A176TD10_9FLAO|nr:hypothetical protein LPB303_07235 [Polaribacter atrinae]